MSESNKTTDKPDKPMNIWEKLQSMRCMLQDLSIKKSGYNGFSDYYYYELGDFLPYINMLLLEHKATSLITFDNENAVMTIVNCEKPDETISFKSPMAGATLRAAHPIQNLGAVETYQRRYLYMTAFEIVESDALDKTQGKKQEENKAADEEKNKSNLSNETRKKLNTQIIEYKKLTGKKTAITKKLEKEIGKPLSEVTEEDAEKIGKIITQWKADYELSQRPTGGVSNE